MRTTFNNWYDKKIRTTEALSAETGQALEMNPRPKAIWLQPGTGQNPREAEKMSGTGIEFYQNRCIKVDHQFLIRTKKRKHNI